MMNHTLKTSLKFNSVWTINYTELTPERQNSHEGINMSLIKQPYKALVGEVDNCYYGLPWPC